MSYFLPQDVLDSKNSAIRDLQYELARVCKVYRAMATYQGSPISVFNAWEPTWVQGFLEL